MMVTDTLPSRRSTAARLYHRLLGHTFMLARQQLVKLAAFVNAATAANQPPSSAAAAGGSGATATSRGASLTPGTSPRQPLPDPALQEQLLQGVYHYSRLVGLFPSGGDDAPRFEATPVAALTQQQVRERTREEELGRRSGRK